MSIHAEGAHGAPAPQVQAVHALRRARWERARLEPAVPAPAGSDALLRALWIAWCADEPQAAVRKAVAAAAAALDGVPGEEAVWYALLRGLEMLRGEGPVRVGAARFASLREAVEAQARRFPGSPRLAVVRARVDGGLGAARAALAVNPAYGPAKVALGRALLREGSPHAARAVLEAVEQPERIQGGAVALARARVESGAPGPALLAAARETNAPGLAALEPSIPDPAVEHEVHEVRGLARLALGAFDAGARSLLHAAAGSHAARRTLVAHARRAEVRGALARLARDGSLSPAARTLAGVLAG